MQTIPVPESHDVSPWRHALRTSVVVGGGMIVLVTIIIAIGLATS